MTQVDEVLGLLSTATAGSLVARHLARCGFPTDPKLVDDVLEEARLVVVDRMADRSPVSVAALSDVSDDASEVVDRVVISVVDDLSRPVHAARIARGEVGRGAMGDSTHRVDHPDGGDHAGTVAAPMVDMIRSMIPGTGAPPGLTSAALAYVTLIENPTLVPVDAVTPPAGIDPNRARAWSALWAGGSEHLFPEPCPATVAPLRDRAVDGLLSLIDGLVIRCRLRMGRDDG